MKTNCSDKKTRKQVNKSKSIFVLFIKLKSKIAKLQYIVHLMAL